MFLTEIIQLSSFFV